ncbi:MAG: hypothetical protein EOP52_08580 [Sphingobacteriales bacterium]|nr:MAG: hypothetical protein EOP52_08580 [Sphingobacteriales bacterium]
MPHHPHKSLLLALREADPADWKSHVKHYIDKKKLSKSEKAELGSAVYHEVLKHALANLQLDDDEKRILADVKTYFQLSDSAEDEIKRHYAPKALKMMIEWFLIDGILTPSEQAQLLAFGQEMKLSVIEITEFIDEHLKDNRKVTA